MVVVSESQKEIYRNINPVVSSLLTPYMDREIP
jgi:hypothetical protein